jgi:hypothetical protein
MGAKTIAATPIVMHTVAEAADLAKISDRYMQIRIADGTGPDVTRIGRRVLIRDDRLRKWIDEQTAGGTMGVPSAEDRAVIADEFKVAVRCYMTRDPVDAVKVIDDSRYPAKLHAAAALHAIARMVAESPNPEQLLDVLAEIVARD